MNSLILRLALFVAMTIAVPVAADYQGPDGYGSATSNELDVSHDGYVREAQSSEAVDPTAYVVVEVDSGQTEQVDGETVIVVQEPEPIAATKIAPPAPQTVVVEQPGARCPGAIWVDGYWYYSNGDYLWVDGHCVVERVNYVFVQPRWDFYANVWWFVPGYYRPWGVYVGYGYYRPWHWFPPHHYPYYHTRHPVPVHRSVPRRPTTVRATPASRAPGRGVLSPTRTGTVARGPARAPTVTRVPTTRTPAVSRTHSSATRIGAVSRGRPTPTPTRTTIVGRPPTSVTRTGNADRVVSQPRANPTRTGTVNRTPSISFPRGSLAPSGSSPSRTGSVRRPSTGGARPSGITGRPTSSPTRTTTVRGPSARPSRGGSLGRPSFAPSRGSSFGRPSVGRGGGFSRPSSGGFGGARSAPPARGR